MTKHGAPAPRTPPTAPRSPLTPPPYDRPAAPPGAPAPRTPPAAAHRTPAAPPRTPGLPHPPPYDRPAPPRSTPAPRNPTAAAPRGAPAPYPRRTPAAPPDDLSDVLAGMRALRRELAPGDGVAAFNRVYLTVTEEIAGRLAAGGFEDARSAGDLAARFAGRYLAAVAPARPAPHGGRRHAARPPACWRVLLRVRADPRVLPVQFAVAGINAHVGHDLALAVVDTCRAEGCPPERLREDFDRVGEVLAGLETRVREQVMPGPDLLEAADPLTHLAGAWSLARARGAAWAAARLLWALRGTDDAYEECVERLDDWVAAVGRLLLAPVGSGRPRAAGQSSGSSTGARSS